MLMGMESSGHKITSDFVKSKLLQDERRKKTVDAGISLATRHDNHKYGLYDIPNHRQQQNRAFRPTVIPSIPHCSSQ